MHVHLPYNGSVIKEEEGEGYVEMITGHALRETIIFQFTQFLIRYVIIAHDHNPRQIKTRFSLHGLSQSSP